MDIKTALSFIVENQADIAKDASNKRAQGHHDALRITSAYRMWQGGNVMAAQRLITSVTQWLDVNGKAE